MSSGGDSKTPIPRYYMSLHMGFMLSADVIKKIWVGEKVGFRGLIRKNTTIDIKREGLFGGIKKEGGISGRVDFMFGRDDQVAPDGLWSRLGLESVDECPGYRGFVSLLFRGRKKVVSGETDILDAFSGGIFGHLVSWLDARGFYWAASNPYLKSIWLTAQRIPVGLTPALSAIPRPSNEKTSICFNLDDSGSMATGSRMPTLRSAVNSTLDLIKSTIRNGQRWDISIQPFDQPGVQILNVDEADIETLKTFVSGLAPVGGHTNFNIAIAKSVTWFNASKNDGSIDQRVNVFVTDGEPNPTNSDDLAAATAANLLNRNIPVDMYGFNIDLLDTTATYKVQNSYDRFVPVVSGSDPDKMAEYLRPLILSALDANPAAVIYECFTNTDWGMGASATGIDKDSFEEAAQTLFDENFGVFLQWQTASSIQDFVNEVLNHIDGAVFPDPRTGKTRIKLLRDDYGDVEDLRVIDRDNAVMTNFSRKGWGETSNEMIVTWTNPETENEETVTRHDLGNIAIQGYQVSDSRNYYGVRTANLALRLADRELRKASAPLASCEVVTDREFWDVTPLEVLVVNWPELGFNNLVMRVMKVDYGKTGDSKIKLSLVEDVFSLAQATFVGSQAPQWTDPNQFPRDIERARILPLPYYLVAADGVDPNLISYPATRVAVLAESPLPDNGVAVYDQYIEQVGPTGSTEWTPTGTTQQFVGHGQLTDALGLEVESVVVPLSSASGEPPDVDSMLLIGPDSGDVRNLEIAFVTSVDNLTGDVTILRGCLDTVPHEWPAGTKVWVCSIDQVDQLPLDFTAGQSLSIRLTTQTTLGSTDVDVAPEFTAVVDSRVTRPTRPANVKMNTILLEPVLLAGASLDVTWATRNRTLEDTVVYGWTDGSVAAEPGVTTSVRWYDNTGTLIDEVTGITGESQIIDLTSAFGNDFVTVEVTAVNADDEDSWQPERRTVYTTLYPLPIVNPGAETGDSSGWYEIVGGGLTVSGYAHTGSYSFIAGTSTLNWYAQDIAIDSGQWAAIDTGEMTLGGEVWLSTWSGDTDYGYYGIAAFDAAGNWLGERFTRAFVGDSYELERAAFHLPVGTRSVRVGVRAYRVSGTDNNNTYADDFAGGLFDLSNGACVPLYSRLDMDFLWYNGADDTEAAATVTGYFDDTCRSVGGAVGVEMQTYRDVVLQESQWAEIDADGGTLQVMAEQYRRTTAAAEGYVSVTFLDAAGDEISSVSLTPAAPIATRGSPVFGRVSVPAGSRVARLGLNGKATASGGACEWSRVSAMYIGAVAKAPYLVDEIGDVLIDEDGTQLVDEGLVLPA